ncbi:MAG: hypothetical protein ACOX0U_04920 [Oscillospiraceae bacterium]|jgi:hypothetical protein
MAIASFAYDMHIISSLEDEPNDIGGLTAGELKAKFDEGGLALQAYVNYTLLPGVAAEINAALLQAAIGRVPGMTVMIPAGEEIPVSLRIPGAAYWKVTEQVAETAGA